MGAGTIGGDYWVDNLAHWSRRLSTERDIDSRALTDWCSLYSASEFRKAQALELLHKVLKKDSGGYAVRNPSAFVVTGVKEAWHKVPVQLPDCRTDGGGSGSWGGGGWDGGSWDSAWRGGGGWGSGGWGW